MNIYKLQYTDVINRITRDRVEYFEASNNSQATTQANNIFPEGVINKKLYNLGSSVSI